MQQMHRTRQACQVCNDPSAAFYCGANVCEACKKFFIRSWKQSKENNYVCLQDNKCTLNKETRKRCASCRYDRCLGLNMYLPGGPSLMGEISKIPCRVCNAPSSGFHFGTITCEGCKGFFRRCCQDKKIEKFKCNENASCKVSSGGRGLCKACRLKRCFVVGMQVEKCKIGRRPNIIKHTTRLEVQKIIKEHFMDQEFEEPLKKHSKPSQRGNRQELTIDHHRMDSEINEETSSDIKQTLASFSSPCDSNKLQKSRDISEEDVLHLFTDSVTNSGSVDNWFDDMTPYNNTGAQSQKHPNAVDSKDFNRPNLVDLPDLSQPIQKPGECFERLLPKFPPQRPPVRESEGVEATSVDLQGHNWCSHPPIRAERENVDASTDFLCGHQVARSNVKQTTFADGDVKYVRTLLLKYSSPSVLEKPTYEEMICIMKNSFSYLSPILSKPPNSSPVTENSSLEEMWEQMMLQFERCAYSILAFARHIPGFKKLPLSAQIELIQKSLYPLVVCVLSLRYDPKDNSYSYFNFTPSETKIILTSFPMCHPLAKTLICMGQKVKSIDMDEVEIAFLCAVYLLDFGGRYDYKELQIDSLEFYVKAKCGTDTERHHHILMMLRTMSDLNQAHRRMIADILRDPKFSSLTMTQLYEEAFLDMDYAEL